jgi:catechol 2,3-dioxygenase-like lactoylglutathione lyase family enzyme
MTIQRLEHVGIVVDDLEDATAFFVELGLELQGEWRVEGGWVDRVVGPGGDHRRAGGANRLTALDAPPWR